MHQPELLAPAGSLDKLKAAVAYGADAVYVAGQKYGLRSAAENFTLDELAEGVALAHQGHPLTDPTSGTKGRHPTKVYVVLNSFLHDSDLPGLRSFLKDIEAIQVDGVIASDLGVITEVSTHTKIPIHLSTQASCLNVASAQLWKKMGVSRLILGREASIQDAGRIKRATGLEVELFIHGSMCMAYSGNCTISNFTQGRDSNRGGCAQSCRFSYSLEFPSGQRADHRFFMSSKDLMGIDLLPAFFEEEVDSVKIEGRMRSPMYAGLISKIYREAIDAYAALMPKGAAGIAAWKESLPKWSQELAKLPHRDYMSGSLETPADLGSTLDDSVAEGEGETGAFEYLGLVRRVEPGQYLLVEVKNKFSQGMKVELVPFVGPSLFTHAEPLLNSVGDPIPEAKVANLVRIPFLASAQVGNLVRLPARLTCDQPSGLQQGVQ